MEKGNLSCISAPRIMLVFEGALGFIDEELQERWKKAIRQESWSEAASYWHLNETLRHKITDLARRKNYNIEIVTFIGSEEWAKALEDWLNLPIAGVTMYLSAQELAHELAYRPEVIAVYDPEHPRWMAYGSKGVYLENVSQFGD